MLAALRQSGGLNAISRQLGAAPGATNAVVEVLMPRVLERFRCVDGGVSELVLMLGTIGGGALAAAVMSHEPADPAPGAAIVRRLGGRIAFVLGVQPDDPDDDLAERILPLLVMIAGGYLAARAAAKGVTAAELEHLLRPDAAPPLTHEEPV